MWYWEVMFKDSKGVLKILQSENGYESRALAFAQYMEDCEAITEALKQLDCKVVFFETIVFDNNHILRREK